jgi:5-methylcytosine-specific restriction endonuclease McrA
MGSKHLGSGKWKTQRLIVLKRDCYTCAYCGEPANEVDHIQPRVLGGTDDLDNLVAACRRCNAMKGKRSEALFLGQSSTPPVFWEALSPRAASVIPENPFVTETTPAIN